MNRFGAGATVQASADAHDPLAQTLALVSLMRRRGVAPRIYTYSTALVACEMRGGWLEARAVLRAMQRRRLRPRGDDLMKVWRASFVWCSPICFSHSLRSPPTTCLLGAASPRRT